MTADTEKGVPLSVLQKYRQGKNAMEAEGLRVNAGKNN